MRRPLMDEGKLKVNIDHGIPKKGDRFDEAYANLEGFEEFQLVKITYRNLIYPLQMVCSVFRNCIYYYENNVPKYPVTFMG